MDDILKRMLAVEKEADKIVLNATEEAEKILEDSRQKANEIAAEAQSDLAKEVEEMTARRIDEAVSGKADRLREADEKMKGELEAFRKEVSKHLDDITRILLFPEPARDGAD
ncbi:MAG: hypothetical protein IJS15_15835 [Victivallales bacterium]|nr:hypothetical protein [Victivallales bacterium]